MSEMGAMVLMHDSPTGLREWMTNTNIPEPVINSTEEAWRNRID